MICLSKKEIIILVIVFLLVIFISTISIYFIINRNPNQKKENNVSSPSISNVLKVGEYSLKYGLYKGIVNEYNSDTEKLEKKEITLTLSKSKINDEIYEVKGMSLYVNGYEMYKVIANNKIELLAGEGVEFIYEGK